MSPDHSGNEIDPVDGSPKNPVPNSPTGGGQHPTDVGVATNDPQTGEAIPPVPQTPHDSGNPTDVGVNTHPTREETGNPDA